MALKDRLRTLRQQSGQVAMSVPAAASLADRVARLRPTAGAAPAAAVRRVDTKGLAAALGGEWIAEGLLCIERRIPLDVRHGRIELARLLHDHRALPEANALAVEHAVFLDTETTGLSGGSGTTVFLLGLGRVVGDALVVRQYLITAFAGERAMLCDAADWLPADSHFVSFNGKAFDVPLLSARCRLARVADPFAGRPHVDLLHPTRRLFARGWDDCRLGTAEQRLLGFARSDDLPGSEAPGAWFTYLHRGDAGLLPAVARHNHWDIVSLAALLPALARAHAVPHGHGADVLAAARAWLREGEPVRAAALLEAGRAALDEAGRLELARLYRARGDWASACAIWLPLADAECGEAIERLAKYHEHVSGDIGQAHGYALRLPPSPERDHRLARLALRLGAAPANGALF